MKAKIVARGFQKILDIYYFDAFAHVVRWLTIRSIMLIATKRKWKVRQMDVKTMFLNVQLNEKMYMEIPKGFEGMKDPTKVCKLNRTFYDLK